MVNIILFISLLILVLILFLKVYISEDDRTLIYNKMEEDMNKKLEGKSGFYKLIYSLYHFVI